MYALLYRLLMWILRPKGATVMPASLKRNELQHIDERIASAWAALNGARAATWHSPNRDSLLVEEMCERTVNELLERRHEMTEGVRA